MAKHSISVSLDPKTDSAIQQLANQKNITRNQAALMILKYGVTKLVEQYQVKGES